MKIAICVPHTGTLKARTAQCLAGMLVETAQMELTYNGERDRAEFALVFGDGSTPLDMKRTQMAAEAIKAGADYILWIDSDQTFPKDALIRLMAHNKPVVGTNYARRPDGGPTVFDILGGAVSRRSGIEEVGGLGLGFCLFQTWALQRIPAPWFEIEGDDDGNPTCGEDVYFCNRARATGIQIYVDHDIDIGHIAEQVLTLEKESVDAGAVLPESGAQ